MRARVVDSPFGGVAGCAGAPATDRAPLWLRSCDETIRVRRLVRRGGRHAVEPAEDSTRAEVGGEEGEPRAGQLEFSSRWSQR
jgi:hypothetical protein